MFTCIYTSDHLVEQPRGDRDSFKQSHIIMSSHSFDHDCVRALLVGLCSSGPF